MASYFGRVNIADECDKFAERTSEGSDPITLFRKARVAIAAAQMRLRQRPRRGPRYHPQRHREAEQLWQYHLRCPECDGIVLPNHEHLSIPSGASHLASSEACNSPAPIAARYGMSSNAPRVTAPAAGSPATVTTSPAPKVSAIT